MDASEYLSDFLSTQFSDKCVITPQVATVTKYLTRSVLNKWTLLEYITNILNVPVVNATMILGLMGYF